MNTQMLNAVVEFIEEHEAEVIEQYGRILIDDFCRDLRFQAHNSHLRDLAISAIESHIEPAEAVESYEEAKEFLKTVIYKISCLAD